MPDLTTGYERLSKLIAFFGNFHTHFLKEKYSLRVFLEGHNSVRFSIPAPTLLYNFIISLLITKGRLLS